MIVIYIQKVLNLLLFVDITLTVLEIFTQCNKFKTFNTIALKDFCYKKFPLDYLIYH